MEESPSILTQQRRAVVTGGNKGIGLEICMQLASSGVFVILTARDAKRGNDAVEHLKASGLPNVVYHQLDVEDTSSIASLVNFIDSHFKELDILVNNAGISGLEIDSEAFRDLPCGYVNDLDPDLLKRILKPTYEGAEKCLRTNYYGTRAVTEALLPFLQLSSSANIVNVSSIYGKIQNIPNEKVKLELENVENLTEERLDELLQCFLKDFKKEKLEANGSPINISAYKLSKAAVNAYTRILAWRYHKMRINCVHPGYVRTDMSLNRGY